MACKEFTKYILKVVAGVSVPIFLGFGASFYFCEKLDRSEEEDSNVRTKNAELRQTLSNLVQRVNYNHGTNLNYRPSGSKK